MIIRFNFLKLYGFLTICVHFLCSCGSEIPSSDNKDETAITTLTQKTENEKYQEWVENNPTSTEKSEANDEIEGSLYRNNKYNFRIRFIDNWTFRKGDSKSTVIKSVQADSGKTISVLVEDFPNFKLDNNILSQEELNQEKKRFVEHSKLQNVTPTNIEIHNGFLNNFPATIKTFNTIARSQTMELEYAHKQIHCISDGKLYNISISMPAVLFDAKENKRINRVIESFVFEKGM